MRFTRSEGSLFVKILRNSVLVLLVIIFISIVYNFRNMESDTESALIAEATASIEFKGVFIRNETPVAYYGGGTLSYSVSDGGRLGNGSVIAVAYPDPSQIDRNREAEKLRRDLDILQKIQNPGTRESAQPSDLSASIEENYRNLIFCRDMNDRTAISNVTETLLIQMSTYQIITGSVNDFTAQINDINMRLAQLEQQKIEPSEVIKADRSAYFVSYCDGYEDKLNSNSLDSVTIDMVREVTDSRKDDKNIIGKLVDGYCWYMAGVIDNSRKEYTVGSTVSIRPESSADTFTAKIVDVRDEGDPKNTLIIIQCSEFSYDLVQHRTENVELIRGHFKGLKVPREAIRFVSIDEKTGEETADGKPSVTSVNYKGVYILKGEQPEFKKIDVVYEGSDYVLSAEHTDDKSYLQLYDDIMIEGVD